MKILVDAFGGDNAPVEIVKGAVEALNAKEGFSVALVGKEEETKKALEGLKYDSARLEVIPASEVITCEEEPTMAIRKKPDSSLCVSFKMLKEGLADALVSAGSTGAVLVGSTLKVGRIKGVSRPALCPILPTLKGDKKVLLLDAGANADCKAEYLLQFAMMGGVYAEAVTGVKNPKVALLSNGTEDKKGNQLTHEVFELLKNAENINFVGNVEARDILSGEYDVVVADGFSGNVALKSMEGAIGALFSTLKEEIYSSFIGKIGGLLLKKSFKKVKAKMDYNKFGGAVFLGVDKVVIKTHGSAKCEAVKNSVLQAVNAVNAGLIQKISQWLDEINQGTQSL